METFNRDGGISDANLNDIASILKDIRNENEKEQKYTRKLLRIMQIMMLAMLLVIMLMGFVITSYIPRVNSLLTESEAVMTNLNTVTTELTTIDFPDTINNVNSLVVSSQSDITDAMEKINKIDFEGLNNAIKDLESVISPLSKLFGRR
ncbi:MAG: hypothetical protein PHY47_08665 [Lachnospiraceae bacterium]|nr:hypothetical protein [Lachnospiraceae bacterium]